MPDDTDATRPTRRRIGLALGLALFVGVLLAPAPAGLSVEAWRTVAVLALMAAWWATEAIPLGATALAPVLLFPLLRVRTASDATMPYADPVVFLFLGGFLLAAAVERHGLHRRLALALLARVGTRPRSVIGGVMLVTALLSMWVSNTATTLMMLPIGVSLAATIATGFDERERRSVSSALLLGIAFAASIGGVATLVGTPPNALFAGYMREAHGVEIGFAQWMLLGVPFVAITLPATWFLLTRVTMRVPDVRAALAPSTAARDLEALGSMTRAQRRVAAVFALTALAWITRPLFDAWVPLTDSGIAMGAGLALFVLPASRGTPLLTWRDAARIPWGVLLLFGGGLSLASALQATGLAQAIGDALAQLSAIPFVALVLILTTATVLLSEVASNTATAALLLPIAGSVAVASGYPAIALAAPLALAASGGFMLPVATPPNAVCYGSGLIRIGEMVRAGALLDVVFVLLAALAVSTLAPLVF